MSDDPFDQLHAAVAHHIVNSLGWRSLRPLQSAAIESILAGDHAIAMAPTAGGKTEAAFFPLLSRMLSEDWRGLTVLYVCPLRALLNNLHVRLEGYGRLVGRSVGLWHGDTSQPERDRLLAEPPDILLTTPESIESMLVSRRVDHQRWFADVRSVVIDEAHAFAGDDRGWHLLAVLERVSRLAGREVQRIALSATLGNPDELLAWLTMTCRRPGHVLSPTVATTGSPEVTLDYVGSLDNAALVISRLHRGEKRLVFVDSRARAEKLAAALRTHEVTTFVSHGSLGAGERRSAEAAFSEARNCVIVATSTLELGIDVGDLDRVIQIDAPPTVAAFLQRLGRTGRRTDMRRNALLLATSDPALLRGASILLRWSEGYVEPITPPPDPFHLAAQQLLALALQDRGVGQYTWTRCLGDPFVLGPRVEALIPEIVEHLLKEGYLDDQGGVLGIGAEAEAAFGRKHFMELLSVFTSPPVLSVRHGRDEIGLVPDEALLARPPGAAAGGAAVLTLAGRGWLVLHVDWARRIVQVEPTDAPGIARWNGGGQPLGAHVARGIRAVLCGTDPTGVELSARAQSRLAQSRNDHWWAQPATTTVVSDPSGKALWWTFAGWKANLWLAAISSAAGLRNSVNQLDDLAISLDPGAESETLRVALCEADPAELALAPWITAEAIDGLKFAECLPRARATELVARRLANTSSVAVVQAERLSSAILTA
ncbi:MAG: DEAD/DEAH box helicase [Actinomycetota bacterium]|nr:DEAD/DEAH box helicase [Actinomycetota bacterium]